MLIDVHGHGSMFGTDSCKRSDVNSVWRTVATIRDLRENRKLSEEALE